MPKLFVYGSLKRGFSNHDFLRGQRFLGEARTIPAYRMYDYGGYPGVVPAESGGYPLEGELWRIDEACLANIDQLEGIDEGLYARATAKLAPPHEQLLDVILYHYARDVSGLPEAGGEWRREWDRG